MCRLAYNGAVAAGQLAVFQGASEAPMGAVMAVATEDRAPVPVGDGSGDGSDSGDSGSGASDSSGSASGSGGPSDNTGPSDNGDPDSDPPAATDPTDPTAVNNAVDFAAHQA